MVGGKGLFSIWFRVKMACTRAAKELSSMLLCSSHAIGWASKLQPSGTQLRGFWRNCVDSMAHLQTSNFK